MSIPRLVCFLLFGLVALSGAQAELHERATTLQDEPSISCTTAKDYTRRGIYTTTLPSATAIIQEITQSTVYVTKSVRAPRTVTFTSVTTDVSSVVVAAPTPTIAVLVTPTSYVVKVPTTTSIAPTFTPVVTTTTTTQLTDTVFATSTFYDIPPPLPTLAAAVAGNGQALQRQRRGLGQQAIAEAVQDGELEKRATSRPIGRGVVCQATSTVTSTSTGPPITFTTSILMRPTAQATSTIRFVVTSTSTPAGQVTLQTVTPAVTTTLFATETISSTSTPTASVPSTSTVSVELPAPTVLTEFHYNSQCARSRDFTNKFAAGGYSSDITSYQTSNVDVAQIQNADECCSAAALFNDFGGFVPFAWVFRLGMNGQPKTCTVVIYTADECVAGDGATTNPMTVDAPNTGGRDYVYGLLQCAVGLTYYN